LPFEESIYQKEGVNGVFIGHPGVEDFPIDLDKNSARAQLGISKDQKTVLFMLGSRHHEIDQNYDILKRFLKLNQEVLVICVAADSSLATKINNRLKSDDLQSRVKTVIEDSAIAMRAADVGVIKSGTSTLEAGIMNLPHVVIYRVSWWTEQLVKWIVRFPGPFALVNLALGSRTAIVPEFLGHKIDIEKLMITVSRLMTDEDERKKQLEHFSKLRSVFFTTQKSSEIAADKIIEVLGD
jgi:lipid-A-disaccharide synthase